MHDFEVVCEQIIVHKAHKCAFDIIAEFYYVPPPPVAVLKEDCDIFDDGDAFEV